MRDHREQLQEIRSKVREAGPSEPPTSGFRLSAAILPEFGKVVSYDEARGFGQVSMGHSWFFHASGHLFGNNHLSAQELVGEPVLFITGSTPRDSSGRVRAVKWCPARELGSELRGTARSQRQLDEYRAEWFKSQNLETLLSLLTAKWYAEIWGELKPPRNLHDEVFLRSLIDALERESCEKLCALNLHETLAQSPFEFTRHWLLRNEHFTCGHLLNHLSPEQLVAFGSPRIEWFAEADEPQKARLIAWSLLSRISSEDRRNWLSLVDVRERWASDLAALLTESRWQDQPAKSLWEQDVLASVSSRSAKPTQSSIEGCSVETPWFDLLPRRNRVAFLSQCQLADDSLVALLRSRNDAGLVADFISKKSLALDLETDGEDIWEIGIATRSGSELVLAESHAAKRDKALRRLAQRIAGSTLIVGHNLLGWDWPILRNRLGLQQEPLIWDTLLFETLRRPWAASLALGGSHHAHEDAAQTFALFQEQLASLPADLGLAVLGGQIRNTSELFSSLLIILAGEEWMLPAPQAWVQQAKRKVPRDQMLLVPLAHLRALDWCPEVAVVAAGETQIFPVEKYEINPKSLVPVDPTNAPDGLYRQAVEHIVAKAARHRLRVRLDMLPRWLHQKVRDNPEFRATLERPSVGTAELVAAPIPDADDWWAEDNSQRYVCLAPLPDRVICGRSLVSLREIEQTVSEGPVEGADRIARARSAPFRRSLQSSSRTTWLLLDRPLAYLPDKKGPWKRFSTVQPGQRRFDSVFKSVPSPAVLPRLMQRGTSVLHPGAEDQRAYWKDVLRCLATIRSDVSSDEVPLLLVSSSSSQELILLLQQALAETGLGEVHPDHHSRSERLRRASRAGHCLVDSVANWPAWLRLSEEEGIGTRPVIEAVPLEEWYAASPDISAAKADEGLRDLAGTDDDWEDDAAGDDTEDEPDLEWMPRAAGSDPVSAFNVSRSRLLESVPALAKLWLNRWLWECGFSNCEIPPVILDGRLACRQRPLRAITESYFPSEIQFGVDQTTRLEAVLACFSIERADAPQDYAAMQDFLVRHWNRGRREEDPNLITDFVRRPSAPRSRRYKGVTTTSSSLCRPARASQCCSRSLPCVVVCGHGA
jgi:hypothetical protein